MIAGALEVQLLANVARLQKDMAEAKGIVGGAAREIERFAGGMRTALGAIGFGLSAAGIVAWGKSIIDAADELSKLSQRTGLAVRELSELQYAGRLSDVTTESLSKGVKGLSQKMLEATEATSKAGKIMTALGVDIRGGAMPAIERIADAFAALPDGPTKTAVAVELFGKAGMDMIPMLNQGSAGLEKMREEARRLGIVMDEETARAAEAFNDNLTTVRASSERLGITLLNEVAPALVRISADMKQAALDGGVLDGVLAGLRSTWSEIFFGDPEKNRIRAIREEIGLLMPMLEEAPGLAARVATLNKELAGLLAFQNLSGRNQAFGGATGSGQVISSTLEDSLRRAFETSTKTTKAMKELALADEHVVLWMRRIVEEAQRVNKEFDDQFDAVEKLRLAREGTIKNIREYAERLELETKWLGLSNAEREREIALLHLEAAGLDRNAKDVQELANRIRDAVMAQEEIRSQVSVWNQVGDAAGNFATALLDGPANALDYLRRLSKQWLAELIAIFAKRWVLQLGAGLIGGTAGSALAAQAGQVGQGSLMGNVAGFFGSSLIGTSAVGAGGAGAFAGATAAGSVGLGGTLGTIAAAIPYVAAFVAVASILQSVFGDKGENPNFRWMQGTGGAGGFGGISSSGNFGFDDAALLGYIGGLDARFASLLGPEGSAAASANLSRYTGTGLRMGGQPAQFAFPEGDATAGEQLAMELLQSRYGILFEGIDAGIAEQIKKWGGTSADLQVFIEAMLTVAEGVGKLGITGLNIESLRALAVGAETLDQTFQRVAGAWSWFTDNFYTEAEKLAMAEDEVTAAFAALGIAVPDSITGFRELVESLDLSTEAGRAMWTALMGVAPAFLTVSQAAGGATSAINDTTAALERQAEIQRRIEESVRSDRESRLAAITGARGGLTDFLNRTLLDPGLTTLDPFQRLGLAQSEFESILMAANGGDLGAAGRLGGAADTYLRIAREMFGSSPQYGDIFSAVTGGVKGVDDRLAIDQRQLEATLGIQAYLAESVEIQRETRDIIARIGQGAKTAELGTR